MAVVVIKDIDNIFEFKVKDYETVLVGRMGVDEYGERYFYVQKADGTIYKYLSYQIEFAVRIR